MTKRNTNADRIANLEATLATLTTTMATLAQHIQGTPPQPQAVTPTPTPAPTPTPTPTWAQPGWQAQAQPQAITVSPRRAPAPPLPTRPTGVAPTPAPTPIATGAVTPAQAHGATADDRCFLGCRTMRGHQSRPSTGLIEVATGAYWHKGEGSGTRTDPRPGALNAHAAAGTVWRAVCDATGQAGEMSAQAILEALEEMRKTDGSGNRGAPAVLVGEEPINGWRLAPAPFRRASLAEKMASDENAYRRLMAMAAEATAARKRMGRA